MPGGITGHHVPRGYKYRDLALRVEGVQGTWPSGLREPKGSGPPG
jgi:hypothetical protein